MRGRDHAPAGRGRKGTTLGPRGLPAPCTIFPHWCLCPSAQTTRAGGQRSRWGLWVPQRRWRDRASAHLAALGQVARRAVARHQSRATAWQRRQRPARGCVADRLRCSLFGVTPASQWDPSDGSALRCHGEPPPLSGGEDCPILPFFGAARHKPAPAVTVASAEAVAACGRSCTRRALPATGFERVTARTLPPVKGRADSRSTNRSAIA